MYAITQNVRDQINQGMELSCDDQNPKLSQGGSFDYLKKYASKIGIRRTASEAAKKNAYNTFGIYMINKLMSTLKNYGTNHQELSVILTMDANIGAPGRSDFCKGIPNNIVALCKKNNIPLHMITFSGADDKVIASLEQFYTSLNNENPPVIEACCLKNHIPILIKTLSKALDWCNENQNENESGIFFLLKPKDLALENFEAEFEQAQRETILKTYSSPSKTSTHPNDSKKTIFDKSDINMRGGPSGLIIDRKNLNTYKVQKEISIYYSPFQEKPKTLFSSLPSVFATNPHQRISCSLELHEQDADELPETPTDFAQMQEYSSLQMRPSRSIEEKIEPPLSPTKGLFDQRLSKGVFSDLPLIPRNLSAPASKVALPQEEVDGLTIQKHWSAMPATNPFSKASLDEAGKQTHQQESLPALNLSFTEEEEITDHAHEEHKQMKN